jgi:hypothetical protein
MAESRNAARAEAFWERYRQVVMDAGVAEGVAVWYRRHVERFIGFLRPRRLREATPGDIGEFLLRIHRQPDTEDWQVQQADQALRLLYQELVKTPWAAEWSVPLPLAAGDVADAVPSARLGQEAVFEKWGVWAQSLERMVTALRYLHYSYRTEQTYVEWAERFVRTVREREPSGVGAMEVRQFLDRLAVQGRVSASTQNQALNALVFFFRQGLQRKLGELGEFERAKAPRRLPVVLTQGEMERVLGQMEGAKGKGRGKRTRNREQGTLNIEPGAVQGSEFSVRLEKPACPSGRLLPPGR